ncbi:hypothetical protein pD_gene0054 [Vibrio phage 033B]|nr:hypothetical protein pD_gene0054 [Vibrio phage 033B]
MSDDKNPLWPHMVDAHQLDQLGEVQAKHEAQIKAELEGEFNPTLLNNVVVRRPNDEIIVSFIFDGITHEVDLSQPLTKKQVGARLMQLGAELCR